MMNNTLKNQCNVIPGTIVFGKWHQKSYTIIKQLGYGANGVVYLAKCNHQNVALKMSDNSISITSEMNVLKSFAKVQGAASLGPSLLDVDDWERGGKKIPFYAMEYIEGPNLLQFIKQKGETWTPILILQLLSDLQRLHDQGWIFGDLKPENLVVTGPPPKIRCIDVGGTTIKGRAIKEFTEFYDRGYWGLGSRKAEPSYDLFAVAMVMINISYPNRFNKQGDDGKKQLESAVKQKRDLVKYEKVIMRALTGGYQSAFEMREALLQAINPNPAVSKSSKQSATSKQQRTSPQRRVSKPKPRTTRSVTKQQKRTSHVIETVLLVLLVSILYFLYILGQVV